MDDEPHVLDSIRRMLHKTEYELDTVLTVPEALQMMKGKIYDFVLFDFLMPKQDGLDFISHAEWDKMRTKLILITAYGKHKVINEFFKKGVDGYLVKPFSREVLIDSLKRFKTQ